MPYGSTYEGPILVDGEVVRTVWVKIVDWEGEEGQG
jgi:hypothetical protein